ncbi:DUF1660 domain-containing protein [Lactococcus lactis]|uniref:DUF1660 domain-containing protein n=1 Tax=Lactococcus lactis TaxID=1358 RepID=UPI00241677D0|nr:DUF1660 domain-containing protein [Lactococcus lactis]MDG4957953.1 DUF1660 domain-containing protein [Lactococcus lactis]
MKLMCKLFGHKWPEYRQDVSNRYEVKFCDRCAQRVSIPKPLKFDGSDFNRSDLDESENVFPEKWLDKHMD